MNEIKKTIINWVTNSRALGSCHSLIEESLFAVLFTLSRRISCKLRVKQTQDIWATWQNIVTRGKLKLMYNSRAFHIQNISSTLYHFIYTAFKGVVSDFNRMELQGLILLHDTKWT